MAGRKSLKDEIAVLRRYEQLAPKVFGFVQKMFESGSMEDQKWAADWIKPAYAKMIPQKIGGDPDNRTPIPILGIQDVSTNNSNKENTQPLSEDTGSTRGDVSQQNHIDTTLPDQQSTDRSEEHLNLNSVGVLSALKEGSDEGLPEHNAGA